MTTAPNTRSSLLRWLDADAIAGSTDGTAYTGTL
jgi:hypothetical protein